MTPRSSISEVAVASTVDVASGWAIDLAGKYFISTIDAGRVGGVCATSTNRCRP
jgi:hypothetical protein